MVSDSLDHLTADFFFFRLLFSHSNKCIQKSEIECDKGIRKKKMLNKHTEAVKIYLNQK